MRLSVTSGHSIDSTDLFAALVLSSVTYSPVHHRREPFITRLVFRSYFDIQLTQRHITLRINIAKLGRALHLRQQHELLHSEQIRSPCT